MKIRILIDDEKKFKKLKEKKKGKTMSLRNNPGNFPSSVMWIVEWQSLRKRNTYS